MTEFDHSFNDIWPLKDDSVCSLKDDSVCSLKNDSVWLFTDAAVMIHRWHCDDSQMTVFECAHVFECWSIQRFRQRSVLSEALGG